MNLAPKSSRYDQVLFVVALVAVGCVMAAAATAIAGPSVSASAFLKPDGRFDLEAARRAGVQGSLDLNGLQASFDPTTGEARVTPGLATSSQWLHGFGPIEFRVHALAFFGNELVAGGDFTEADGTIANQIASWNGTSWHPLGPGLNGRVQCLAVYGDELYAGGRFTAVGDVPAGSVARWDGVNWNAVAPPDWGPINALAVYGGELFAGGERNEVNQTDVARWNGTSWQSIPDTQNYVNALTVHSGSLYAGTFNPARDKGVLRWTGSGWSVVGTGLNHQALSLVSWNGLLVAGGDFTIAGGVPANHVAAWNGVAWSAFGSGVNAEVSCLATDGTALFAGGTFTSAGGLSASRVARWDGASWSALDSGTDDQVLALAARDGEVFAGGSFQTAGNVDAPRVARWNGSAWSSIANFGGGKGTDGTIQCMTLFDGSLIVGGSFLSAGSVAANCIARWDGTTWHALGSGTGSIVYALLVRGDQLVIGGEFFVATWDGVSLFGSGAPGTVLALEEYGGDLVAAGSIQSLKNIARWNGSSWVQLGAGLNAPVRDLVVWDGDLVAGGNFIQSGPDLVSRLARWNGVEWTDLGQGLGGSTGISALAVYNGDLIASGGIPAFNNIARFNGVEWSALGSGLYGDPYYSIQPSFQIRAIMQVGPDLVVGGYFQNAGGQLVRNVARWDGSAWSSYGFGTTGTVNAIAATVTSLFVGGLFSSTGLEPAANFGWWGTGQPVDVQANAPRRLGLMARTRSDGSIFVSYSLAVRVAALRLSVFDVRGRLVRELVSGAAEAGPHIETWDLKHRGDAPVAPGVYFVRLQAGAERATAKVIVPSR